MNYELKEETKKIIGEKLKKAFNLSYEEFFSLDIEKQEELLKSLHKKKKNNFSNHIMVGSGEDAIFIEKEEDSWYYLYNAGEILDKKIKKITKK